MEAALVDFGRLEIEGERFDQDVVVEEGGVRPSQETILEGLSPPDTATRRSRPTRGSRGPPPR